MNEFNRHTSAQMAFMDTVRRHRPVLAEALQDAGYNVATGASVRCLVRLSRTHVNKPGLHAFEDAVRASLQAYLDTTPKAARHVLESDAQFLVEHFDRFTEVPLTAHPVKRVVIWARRKMRGLLKDPGDVD